MLLLHDQRPATVRRTSDIKGLMKVSPSIFDRQMHMAVSDQMRCQMQYRIMIEIV